MVTFVIEHLEPRLYSWALLEYAHISKRVGRQNLLFTNTSSEALKRFGRLEKQSVTQLNLQKACILDPSAKQELTPRLAKKFEYFIFGGILGDYPPRGRTRLLARKLKCPAFNLGKAQFSTDTAVLVAKAIIDGKRLAELRFQQGLVLEIAEGEEVVLPYKYLVEKGKPVITPGLREMLEKQKSF